MKYKLRYVLSIAKTVTTANSQLHHIFINKFEMIAFGTVASQCFLFNYWFSRPSSFLFSRFHASLNSNLMTIHFLHLQYFWFENNILNVAMFPCFHVQWFIFSYSEFGNSSTIFYFIFGKDFNINLLEMRKFVCIHLKMLQGWTKWKNNEMHIQSETFWVFHHFRLSLIVIECWLLPQWTRTWAPILFLWVWCAFLSEKWFIEILNDQYPWLQKIVNW